MDRSTFTSFYKPSRPSRFAEFLHAFATFHRFCSALEHQLKYVSDQLLSNSVFFPSYIVYNVCNLKIHHFRSFRSGFLIVSTTKFVILNLPNLNVPAFRRLQDKCAIRFTFPYSFTRKHRADLRENTYFTSETIPTLKSYI